MPILTPMARKLLALFLFACACSPGASTPALVDGGNAPRSTAAQPPVIPQPSATSPPVPAGNCGLSPSDWCPSPPGDPCGAHKDTASCKADRRCQGMRYRGESVVACMYDERGFASNCPTVGCVSIPR
jgi:hypothetical protein